MTVLNNIQIPVFTNFSDVHDFILKHKNKLHLHFIQDDGKIQRSAILSNVEEQNNEFNQIDIFHCMQCEAINETIQHEEFCPDCNPENVVEW